MKIRLLGAKVYPNWTFIIVFALYVWAGLFKEITMMFLLILTHETAHLFIARGCDVEVDTIELYPFGGVARLREPLDADPYVETIIAIAGPLNNFVLFGLGSLFTRHGIFNSQLVQVFLDFNLSLALFNLIPALPLDGGRVCRAYLTQKMGYRKATEALCKAGKAISIAMFGAAVAALLFSAVLPGAMFFSGFLYVASTRELKTLPYALMRQVFSKRRSLRSGEILPSIEIIARDTVTLRQICEHFLPRRYHIVRVYDAKGKHLGNIQESEIMDAIFEGKLECSLRDMLEAKR